MKKFIYQILMPAILLLILTSSPVYSNEFKIVNGEETTMEKWEESFSGVVGLLITLSEGISLCTGTIIDPQVILTARHCVLEGNDVNFRIDPDNIDVISGLWIEYASIPKASGKKIVIHQEADIALMLLDKKISGLQVYPVRDNPSETVGEKGVAVGYGVTGTEKEDSGTQRWGETTVLSIWDSESIVEVGNSTGLCFGDSGGPFFTKQNGKDVVSGVSSFVAGECSSVSGSYSVQVVKYRNWIEEQMENLTGHGLGNICGDGDIDDGETCEAQDEKDCSELGSFIPGIIAKCNGDCNGFDVSVCKDQICGDEIKQGSEACDDGNIVDGDYCSSDCQEISGKCGDNKVQSIEECDDGNNESNDGCDYSCKLECGNGWKEYQEECDDGNLDGGDGCDDFCKLECGNDVLNIGEECDDGNRLSEDGCDKLCKKEPGKGSGCSSIILSF